MTTFIYGLICPMDNQLKYVGKANNPTARLKDHMWDMRGVSLEKAQWILNIKKAKLKPHLEILDEVDIEKWKFWEEFYIHYFKSLGFPLFNHRAGNGLTFSNKQTFKPGNIPWNKKKIFYDYKAIKTGDTE